MTFLERGESRSKLMQESNINSSTIYHIKPQTVDLIILVFKAVEKCHTLHKPKLKQLDNIL